MKNGSLKIESGVKIPATYGGGGRGFQPVLKSLKVGQSVVLPVKAYANAWTAACTALGRGKFVVRVDGTGYRVWRTA